METDNNIELLEAYVNGTLTPQQQVQVETRLGNDASFKNDYEMYQLMLSAISENRKTELKSFISKNVKVKPAPFFKTPTFYAAAAASVILCMISYFVVYQKLNEEKSLANQPQKNGVENTNIQTPDSAKPLAENNSENTTSTSGNATEKKDEAVASETPKPEFKNEAQNNPSNSGVNDMSSPPENVAVESDKLKLDTFLSISRKIYIAKPKQYQKNPNDLYAVITTGDKRILEIQFWQSPINYSGYKFSKNLVVIYGNFDAALASFQELKDIVYMKYKNDYYRISPSDNFTGMKKETDAKIIADLDIKN